METRPLRFDISALKGAKSMGNKVSNVLAKAGRNLKKAAPTILSITASVGVPVTAYLSVRASKKGNGLRDYILPTVVGASTVVCILGANALNKKQQATLLGAYIFANESLKEYQAKTKELYGEDAGTLIRDELTREKYEHSGTEVTDDKQLFYEEYYGFFESTTEEVQQAEYHFNRNFALRGYASLNEFHEFLGLEKSDFGELLGWSMEVGQEYYGYSWIDFDHTKAVMDDGLECTIISMPFPPTEDYLN